jgi:hypothetical protein
MGSLLLSAISFVGILGYNAAGDILSVYFEIA